ncbi:CDP-alcohol phosphatidyltransferase family protein [Dysgonomonas sp. 25]|uniref:CDP-alcohol phosphatidyltransferase family protein n=1 Tax=Dysgonomonas sp. 25 TaxID=2302933 RepID=UPI0013CFCBF8|nr:CDP-alcohol phosphatidyltransferase family protein [Dysgonomonas sp. 25]NDV69062.1 CDP-alcohol phosphatidyltransferase [Dysgonomonas sp. 25]
MSDTKSKNEEALSKITKDRSRTNILRNSEQKTLAFLVQRVPSWISSDMLTGIGFFGSILTFASFVLAAYVHPYCLLLGVVGFAVNWFGDSLDGRVAYYRNTPRKWYGFSLDITVDWLTDILIGLGFLLYAEGYWQLVGFAFVTLYGWAMIIALLRYKIVNKYTIDSNLFGPTEVRILLCLFLIAEVLFRGSLMYVGAAACVVLLIINIIDFTKLLKMADQRDKDERAGKESL